MSIHLQDIQTQLLALCVKPLNHRLVESLLCYQSVTVRVPEREVLWKMYGPMTEEMPRRM
jgi:hypothetical protein